MQTNTGNAANGRHVCRLTDSNPKIAKLTLLRQADGGAVAVPGGLQKSLGLDPRATETKENSSNLHYHVAAYHQLHCLVRASGPLP